MHDDFFLGITYWPHSTGMLWWQRHDRGEVRADLDHVRELGIDALRLHLAWEVFQPRIDHVNGAAMRVLEQTLDDAADRGLRVVATLFSGAFSGGLCFPAWATWASPALDVARLARQQRRGAPARPQPVSPLSGPELVIDGRWRTTALRDLYGDDVLLHLQRQHIREVVGYFAQHPALVAWELGHGTELARMPRNAESFAEWQLRLADEARAAGATAAWSALSLYGLAHRDGPRPASLAEVADGLVAWAEPPATLHEGYEGEHPAAVATLLTYALTRQLAPHTRIVVDDPGLPSAWGELAGWQTEEAYGRVRRVFFDHEEQHAIVLTNTLRRLYNGGAQGVMLPALYDASPALHRLAPLDRTLSWRARRWQAWQPNCAPIQAARPGSACSTSASTRRPTRVSRGEPCSFSCATCTTT
jgi:hypothetical protein